jgi:hypothetical protein
MSIYYWYFGYLLLRYSHIVEYGYLTLYYSNKLRRWIFVKSEKNDHIEDINEDWVLCNEPNLLLNTI